jgi:hypothetical protein
MSASTQYHSAPDSAQASRTSQVLVPEMWGTVVIVAMWLAVLFVGIDGGQATFHSVDSSVVTIPSGVFVALFAAIGTVSVAKRVFGRSASE